MTVERGLEVWIPARSAGVIFCHNHPSGVLRPSLEDRELTSRLRAAGDILGIKVLDRLIIGGVNPTAFFSFQGHDLMEEPASYGAKKNTRQIER
ncbi:MAG: hypothetical protein DDT20_01879 [Firmicutes bacterium]|nr:hypothetical protein [Bacillota bacterium]